MHELSIVMSIVDIAGSELKKANGNGIDEIELDIGALSGIETSCFDFAWQQAVKETTLADATCKMNHIPAVASCPDCQIEFPIENLYDACPVCNRHQVRIIQGKELRVKSIVIN